MRNAVQVLIVVLILLVLGGLLASAIFKVRATADQMSCYNNIKQLGLAVCNYQGTFNEFPRAAMPNPHLPPEKRLSWMVVIVPFVESNPLYNKMDKEKGWDAEENRFAALTSWRTFHCPGYPERPPDSTLWPTHYLGITGLGADAIDLPQGDRRAGFFGYDRKLTLADLKRGASAVMVTAETSHATGAWTAAGPPTCRGLEPGGPPYLGRDGQFGGNHSRGANVGFADGSVRFLDASTDPAVLGALATICGGE